MALLMLLADGYAISSGEVSNDSKACLDITGTYGLSGQRVLNGQNPSNTQLLPLDVMLGVDLAPHERQRTVRARLIQKNNNKDIQAEFIGPDLRIGKSLLLLGGSLSCEMSKITIQQTLNTKGEAVSGKADIVRALSIADDGGLVVRVARLSRNRSLVFFWNMQDVYVAKYQRLD